MGLILLRNFFQLKVDLSPIGKHFNHCDRKASLRGVFHLLMEQSFGI